MLVISAARGTGKSLFAKNYAESRKSFLITTQSAEFIQAAMIGRRNVPVVLDDVSEDALVTLLELFTLGAVDIELIIGTPEGIYLKFLETYGGRIIRWTVSEEI